MTWLFKFHMFVASFIPLWLSILFIEFMSIIKAKNNIIESKGTFLLFSDCTLQMVVIILVSATVIFALFGLYRFLSRIQKDKRGDYGTIKEAKKANTLTSEYLLAYILPFFTFDFVTINDLILFLIYLFTLGFLCIRNDNVYANIFIEFLKYKLYLCNIQYKGSDILVADCIIMSKHNLSGMINNEIKTYRFQNFISVKIEE